MICHLAAFCAGFFLDILWGDPLGRFHIVVLIGRGISFWEKALRRILPKTPRAQLAGGLILVLLTAGGSFLISAGSLALLYRLHPAVGLLGESFLCWQCLAMRGLKQESVRVYECRHDLAAARKAVGRIVGRDTEKLDLPGVFRACVETVAENCSDGEIAPMLYLALGGGALGVLYKAVNTMDSMLGYRTPRYLYFGRAAARLDDAANLIPSRLTGLLMTAVAGAVGLDGKNALRIFLRDRYRHSSPNSAQGEAACAGALHIQLGGPAFYFGKRRERPLIGDDDRPIEAEDILRADRLLYGTGWLCFFFCVLVKGAVILLW